MQKKRETRSIKKRAQLLETARMLFLSRGFFAVSMDEVARMSGLSKRTMYRFYNNREALIAAAIVHDFESWQEWFFDAMQDHTGVTGNSLDGFYAVLRLWTERPEFSGCLFARAVLVGDMLPEEVRAAAVSCADALHQFFSRQTRKLGMADREIFARVQVLHLLVLLGDAAPVSGKEYRPCLIGDMQSLFEKW